MSAAEEFALIARCFAPLAAGPIARGLIDDAAVAALAGDIVLTADAIVEGVHFLPSDPIETIGRKALRVNLSDLAAKGARPLGYLLTLCWPQARPAAEIAALAAGLQEDQAAFGIGLWGGDTTATPGPLMLSITALGQAPPSGAPSRTGAEAGDGVWLYGGIGDGLLGLAAARGEDLGLGAPALDALVAHYRTPTPHLTAGQAAAAVAHAMMDVSDGLLIDAGKLAAASGLAIALEACAIPLSASGRAWRDAQPDPLAALRRLAGGGDDYALLAAFPPAAAPGAGWVRVGTCRAGTGLAVLGADGCDLGWGAEGHSHALGSPR